MSRKCIRVVLGNRKQCKNATTENYGGEREYPECFVVNYVLPFMVPLVQMMDGHDLPPFQKGTPFSKRLRLASRAIELGKDDADVFWMAGYAVFRLQMDATRARELVRHSLDLNPNSAIASAIAGAIDSTLDPPEGLRMLLRASRLNPRDPRGWLMKSHLAWAHLIEGQLDEAISAAQRVLNQNPRSAYALRFLAAGLAKRGQVNHAAEAIRTVLDVEPGLTLTKLRTRLMFIEENTWRDYSAALRIAGLGE